MCVHCNMTAYDLMAFGVCGVCDLWRSRARVCVYVFIWLIIWYAKKRVNNLIGMFNRSKSALIRSESE